MIWKCKLDLRVTDQTVPSLKIILKESLSFENGRNLSPSQKQTLGQGPSPYPPIRLKLDVHTPSQPTPLPSQPTPLPMLLRISGKCERYAHICAVWGNLLKSAVKSNAFELLSNAKR